MPSADESKKTEQALAAALGFNVTLAGDAATVRSSTGALNVELHVNGVEGTEHLTGPLDITIGSLHIVPTALTAPPK